MDSTENENPNTRGSQEGRGAPPRVLSLLQGILEDIQTLASQQIQLAVHELQLEGARAASMIVTAILVVILATLSIMLLLTASAAALHEIAGLPVWMSCGIIALIVMAGAGSLLFYLKQQAQRFRLLPFRALHTVKEDIRWIKERIASPRM
jgi:uncharacterized membrane protein YqjE